MECLITFVLIDFPTLVYLNFVSLISTSAYGCLKCHYILHYISYIILITLYITSVRFLDETSFEPYSVSTEVFSLLFCSDVVSHFY